MLQIFDTPKMTVYDPSSRIIKNPLNFTILWICHLNSATRRLNSATRQLIVGNASNFTLKYSSIFRQRVRVRVNMIYFDKEERDIEETNTETIMYRNMSATNAYTEL